MYYQKEHQRITNNTDSGQWLIVTDAIYANTEGCTIGGTTLELKVEAGAYFKKGDVLTSTNGYQFIYNK